MTIILHFFLLHLISFYNFMTDYLLFLFIWFIVATLWVIGLPITKTIEPSYESKSLYFFKQFILCMSYLNFLIFLFVWYQYDYFFMLGLSNLVEHNMDLGLLNQESLIGFSGSMAFVVDPLNLYFLLLTTFITPFCFLSSFESINFFLVPYILLFLMLVIGVILTFLTLNLFYFYFFFEIILLPMFFIIGFWGSSVRRTLAAFYFFFFTMVGSLFLVIAIILLSFEVEDLYIGDLIALSQILINDEILINSVGFLLSVFDDRVLDVRFISHFVIFDSELQLIFWWLFFIPFAIKIPMYPFHIWLPEAHVEAPTSGSMFLAAILLKLGSYGFLRFMLPLFPFANIYYQPFFLTLAVISIFYSSFTALRQIDIKRVIAYSSIAHMNFAILGIFNNDIYGYCGSILIFIGHGFVSAALFYLVGIIYDRYKTRLIFYYSGLVILMPIYGIFFFFFSLGNIAFPGTINFLGELFVLVSVLKVNFFVFCLSGLTLFFSLLFTFWLFTRLIFGVLRSNDLNLFFDVTKMEFYVLSFLCIVMFLFGWNPNIIFDLLEAYAVNLLDNTYYDYYEIDESLFEISDEDIKKELN